MKTICEDVPQRSSGPRHSRATIKYFNLLHTMYIYIYILYI